MPYTSKGIYYPDTSTAMSIADITQDMAESIDDKLGILQIVSATYSSTTTNTSSSSYVQSGLTATITPSSASSKIIVLVNLPFRSAVTNPTTDGWSGADFKLMRGSTSISTTTPYISGIRPASTSTPIYYSHALTMNYTDEPASTSAVTYRIDGKVYAGSPSPSSRSLDMNYSGGGAAKSSIILMELA